MIYDVIVVGGGIAAVEAVRQFTAKDYEEGLRYDSYHMIHHMNLSIPLRLGAKVIIFDKAEVGICVW